MTLQARAQITRQSIIDAAAEVFTELGYGTASLTEMIDRAGVTKGAFHYHFPTKESIALALVDYADCAIADVLEAELRPTPLPALECLVRAAFVVADLARADARVAIGIHLWDSLGHPDTLPANRIRRQELAMEAIDRAVREGDVSADVDPEDVCHTLWVGMLGNQLHARAGSSDGGDDAVATLSVVLRIILRGICTERSAPFFAHFVERLGRQYAAIRADPVS
ncbi:MAG: TetR/AcrR family transcriptional regulator [Mycobacterium sp.]|nr:TetR/AcrR family transcriptional regulator [Mycobacterium sp.]